MKSENHIVYYTQSLWTFIKMSPVLFLKWKMSKEYFVQKIQRPIIYSVIFDKPAFYEVMLKDIAEWKKLHIKI